MTLIGAAKEHGIEFIYAISPGLDITFSNQKEVSALKRKLDQVLHHCMTVLKLLIHIVQEFRPSYALLSVCNDFGFYFQSLSLPARFVTLAASHLPYFLTILTTTCALLTKRCSAHSHTLRFPLPTKSTSTWASPKPSSSVPQVPQLYVWILCTFYTIVSSTCLFIICLFSCLVIQSTVEHSATQMSLSPPTSRP